MALFGLGKRKDEKESKCCCGGNCTPEKMEQAEVEKEKSGVKILGGGCTKCNQLESAVIEALKELGMNPQIEHIEVFKNVIKQIEDKVLRLCARQ